MTLRPEDALFLYTDGVTEAMNPEQRLFSEDRLEQVLNEETDQQPKAVIACVRAAISEFVRDEPQSDDITMLALSYQGNPENIEAPSAKMKCSKVALLPAPAQQ